MFFFASLFAPRPRLTVTIAGNALGTAATARLNENMNNCTISGFRLRAPITNTMITSMIIANPICSANFVNFIWRGVAVCSMFWMVSAIFPNSVFIPVDMTTPLPFPYDTTVPANAIFFCSVSCSAVCSCMLVFFTGIDSPVNDASSICRLDSSNILKSAGMMSPSVNITISPGTSSFAGISEVSLSLNTLAFGAPIFFNASIAFSALYSWMNPSVADNNIIMIIP